jgi:hypothetical protein
VVQEPPLKEQEEHEKVRDRVEDLQAHEEETPQDQHQKDVVVDEVLQEDPEAIQAQHLRTGQTSIIQK